MFRQASERVEVAIANAAVEAGRRGDRRIGTEHLLLGLLHDPEVVAKVGADLTQARAAADDLDRAALKGIGLDLDGEPRPLTKSLTAGNTPPTSGMRATLARAFVIAKSERLRRIEPDHVLQALMERGEPDPVAALFHVLGE